MTDVDPEPKLPIWTAAAWGALLGIILFVEALIVGGLEPGRTLFVMLGLGALLGVEWNELHFLERHGVAGFFARWALAGASAGAVAFGIGRVAEAWPWWGFFGALGIGAVLGSAVGLEWGRLLGDPPWAADRQIDSEAGRGLLQIDRSKTRTKAISPETKATDHPTGPDGI